MFERRGQLEGARGAGDVVEAEEAERVRPLGGEGALVLREPEGRGAVAGSGLHLQQALGAGEEKRKPSIRDAPYADLSQLPSLIADLSVLLSTTCRRRTNRIYCLSRQDGQSAI